MALIVPLLAFAALFWTYWRRDAGADPRGALLAASVTWEVLATGIVATLSQVEWLTAGALVPQLYYPPWSSYAMLQLSLPGWDERLATGIAHARAVSRRRRHR
jgi:hypothetical protein